MSWGWESERVGKYMIRYYGLYSNAHRGKMRKAGICSSRPPIIEGEYHLHSKGWAEIIRKVSEVEKRGVFLRAFFVVLCLLEGRVYLELDGLEISGNLCRFMSH